MVAMTGDIIWCLNPHEVAGSRRDETERPKVIPTLNVAICYHEENEENGKEVR